MQDAEMHQVESMFQVRISGKWVNIIVFSSELYITLVIDKGPVQRAHSAQVLPYSFELIENLLVTLNFSHNQVQK